MKSSRKDLTLIAMPRYGGYRLTFFIIFLNFTLFIFPATGEPPGRACIVQRVLVPIPAKIARPKAYSITAPVQAPERTGALNAHRAKAAMTSVAPKAQ